MQRSISKGLFYGVAVILLLWTASLTCMFVATALPQAHWLVPIFALVVFDAGMLAWLKVFLDYAQGNGQRALALILCLVDFLGVGLMVLAEILLGGQTLVTPPENLGEYAIWGIAVWTVANVGGVLAFHLLSPDARRKVVLQGEMDLVFDEALKKLSTRRAAMGGELSDRLADGLLIQLVAGLGASETGAAVVPAVTATPPESASNHRGEETFFG